jgi:type II secretory pathway pseudopilin PulG
VTGRPDQARQAGFTYIGLLLAVAIMGVWLAATANVWHLRVQREKEQELLFIGSQFRQALNRYSASTLGSGRRFPVRLEDLLLDERSAQKRRHLRRIYTDPMTGKAEWGLVRLADGQIIGVHSLSTEQPVKKAGFGLRDLAFTGKQAYSQWAFLAAARAGSVPAAPAPKPSSPFTVSPMTK